MAEHDEQLDEVVMAIQKIVVPVEKFQTSDGCIHNSYEDAENSEKMSAGIRIVCPECGGHKKVDPYGDGREFVSCPKCSGKGFLEKETVWK
jgi:DnaJ-class molecular chaperone